MKSVIRLAFHPAPERDKFDTSLRYTDILFGFVIRELFLRLQNWNHVDRSVHLHLLVGATLILGSWIGYRRSLHRSGYQVKFFNLPLLRFIADQLMLILYFRIAVMTDVGGKGTQVISELSKSTVKLVIYVFILYLVWDLLGIWMAKARTAGTNGKKKPLYPALDNSKESEQEQLANWRGLVITASSLGFLFLFFMFADCVAPNAGFAGTIVLLLLYRWVKEMRTSWELLPRV
jgi:hypothetical protein